MGNFQDLINQHQLVLVDFSAEWCYPCKMFEPVLNEVTQELQGKVSILKVDVDQEQELVSQFHVQGTPTVILYQGGNPVWRQSGLITKYELTRLIRHYVA